MLIWTHSLLKRVYMIDPSKRHRMSVCVCPQKTAALFTWRRVNMIKVPFSQVIRSMTGTLIFFVSPCWFESGKSDKDTNARQRKQDWDVPNVHNLFITFVSFVRRCCWLMPFWFALVGSRSNPWVSTQVMWMEANGGLAKQGCNSGHGWFLTRSFTFSTSHS